APPLLSPYLTCCPPSATAPASRLFAACSSNNSCTHLCGYSRCVSFHSYKICSRSLSGTTSTALTAVPGALSSASTRFLSTVSMYSHILFGPIHPGACAVNPNPSPRSSTDITNG